MIGTDTGTYIFQCVPASGYDENGVGNVGTRFVHLTITSHILPLYSNAINF